MINTEQIRQALASVTEDNSFSAYLMRLCDGAAQGMDVTAAQHILLAVEDSSIAVSLCEIYAEIASKGELLPWTSPRNFLALRYPLHGANREYPRFFGSPTVVAEPYNRFGGVFLIDISEWRHQMDSLAFHQLMQYARSHQASMLFVFTIDTIDPAVVAEFAAQLGKQLPIRQYTIEARSVEPYFEYARQLLSESGVQLARAAIMPLRQAIERMQQSADWKGMETVSFAMHSLITKIELGTPADCAPVLTCDVLTELRHAQGRAMPARDHHIGFGIAKEDSV